MATCCLTASILGVIWNTLPETVPIHFKFKGEADGWGSKNTLIWLSLGLTLGIYLLMTIIPKLDPKQKMEQMGNKFYLLKLHMVLFMTLLTCFTIYAAKTGSLAIGGKTIYVVIGLMLAVLGNYFQSIKPNYFIGIRTPWTLESETVWKKTHRLAGRLWMPAGILICLLPFLLSTEIFKTLFIIISCIIVGIPLVYSYLEFQKVSKQ